MSRCLPLNGPVTVPLTAQPRDLTALTPARDQVDVIVEHWCEGDPNLDVITKTAALRLCRVAHHLERELRRELTPMDAEMWEFDVLLTLRRVPGYQLSAGALSRICQVTSGAISNRLGRLEQRGWITRDIDTRDRRHVLVTLTPEGLTRAGELVATKTMAEERIFAGLDRPTLVRMANDLRTLLVAFEGPLDEEAELTAEQLALLSCVAAAPT
jgi:DNA-binding MarR family transcriptional regulator